MHPKSREADSGCLKPQSAAERGEKVRGGARERGGAEGRGGEGEQPQRLMPVKEAAEAAATSIKNVCASTTKTSRRRKKRAPIGGVLAASKGTDVDNLRKVSSRTSSSQLAAFSALIEKLPLCAADDCCGDPLLLPPWMHFDRPLRQVISAPPVLLAAAPAEKSHCGGAAIAATAAEKQEKSSCAAATAAVAAACAPQRIEGKEGAASKRGRGGGAGCERGAPGTRGGGQMEKVGQARKEGEREPQGGSTRCKSAVESADDAALPKAAAAAGGRRKGEGVNGRGSSAGRGGSSQAAKCDEKEEANEGGQTGTVRDVREARRGRNVEYGADTPRRPIAMPVEAARRGYADGWERYSGELCERGSPQYANWIELSGNREEASAEIENSAFVELRRFAAAAAGGAGAQSSTYRDAVAFSAGADHQQQQFLSPDEEQRQQQLQLMHQQQRLFGQRQQFHPQQLHLQRQQQYASTQYEGENYTGGLSNERHEGNGDHESLSHKAFSAASFECDAASSSTADRLFLSSSPGAILTGIDTYGTGGESVAGNMLPYRGEDGGYTATAAEVDVLYYPDNLQPMLPADNSEETCTHCRCAACAASSSTAYVRNNFLHQKRMDSYYGRSSLCSSSSSHCSNSKSSSSESSRSSSSSSSASEKSVLPSWQTLSPSALTLDVMRVKGRYCEKKSGVVPHRKQTPSAHDLNVKDDVSCGMRSSSEDSDDGQYNGYANDVCCGCSSACCWRNASVNLASIAAPRCYSSSSRTSLQAKTAEDRALEAALLVEEAELGGVFSQGSAGSKKHAMTSNSRRIGEAGSGSGCCCHLRASQLQGLASESETPQLFPRYGGLPAAADWDDVHCAYGGASSSAAERRSHGIAPEGDAGLHTLSLTSSLSVTQQYSRDYDVSSLCTASRCAASATTTSPDFPPPLSSASLAASLDNAASSAAASALVGERASAASCFFFSGHDSRRGSKVQTFGPTSRAAAANLSSDVAAAASASVVDAAVLFSRREDDMFTKYKHERGFAVSFKGQSSSARKVKCNQRDLLRKQSSSCSTCCSSSEGFACVHLLNSSSRSSSVAERKHERHTVGTAIGLQQGDGVGGEAVAAAAASAAEQTTIAAGAEKGLIRMEESRENEGEQKARLNACSSLILNSAPSANLCSQNSGSSCCIGGAVDRRGSGKFTPAAVCAHRAAEQQRQEQPQEEQQKKLQAQQQGPLEEGRNGKGCEAAKLQQRWRNARGQQEGPQNRKRKRAEEEEEEDEEGDEEATAAFDAAAASAAATRGRQAAMQDATSIAVEVEKMTAHGAGPETLLLCLKTAASEERHTFFVKRLHFLMLAAAQLPGLRGSIDRKYQQQQQMQHQQPIRQQMRQGLMQQQRMQHMHERPRRKKEQQEEGQKEKKRQQQQKYNAAQGGVKDGRHARAAAASEEPECLSLLPTKRQEEETKSVGSSSNCSAYADEEESCNGSSLLRSAGSSSSSSPVTGEETETPSDFYDSRTPNQLTKTRTTEEGEARAARGTRGEAAATELRERNSTAAKARASESMAAKGREGEARSGKTGEGEMMVAKGRDGEATIADKAEDEEGLAKNSMGTAAAAATAAAVGRTEAEAVDLERRERKLDSETATPAAAGGRVVAGASAGKEEASLAGRAVAGGAGCVILAKVRNNAESAAKPAKRSNATESSFSEESEHFCAERGPFTRHQQHESVQTCISGHRLLAMDAAEDWNEALQSCSTGKEKEHSSSVELRVTSNNSRSYYSSKGSVNSVKPCDIGEEGDDSREPAGEERKVCCDIKGGRQIPSVEDLMRLRQVSRENMLEVIEEELLLREQAVRRKEKQLLCLQRKLQRQQQQQQRSAQWFRRAYPVQGTCSEKVRLAEEGNPAAGTPCGCRCLYPDAAAAPFFACSPPSSRAPAPPSDPGEEDEDSNVLALFSDSNAGTPTRCSAAALNGAAAAASNTPYWCGTNVGICPKAEEDIKRPYSTAWEVGNESPHERFEEEASLPVKPLQNKSSSSRDLHSLMLAPSSCSFASPDDSGSASPLSPFWQGTIAAAPSLLAAAASLSAATVPENCTTTSAKKNQGFNDGVLAATAGASLLKTQISALAYADGPAAESPGLATRKTRGSDDEDSTPGSEQQQQAATAAQRQEEERSRGEWQHGTAAQQEAEEGLKASVKTTSLWRAGGTTAAAAASRNAATSSDPEEWQHGGRLACVPSWRKRWTCKSRSSRPNEDSLRTLPRDKAVILCYRSEQVMRTASPAPPYSFALSGAAAATNWAVPTATAAALYWLQEDYRGVGAESAACGSTLSVRAPPTEEWRKQRLNFATEGRPHCCSFLGCTCERYPKAATCFCRRERSIRNRLQLGVTGQQQQKQMIERRQQQITVPQQVTQQRFLHNGQEEQQRQDSLQQAQQRQDLMQQKQPLQDLLQQEDQQEEQRQTSQLQQQLPRRHHTPTQRQAVVWVSLRQPLQQRQRRKNFRKKQQQLMAGQQRHFSPAPRKISMRSFWKQGVQRFSPLQPEELPEETLYCQHCLPHMWGVEELHDEKESSQFWKEGISEAAESIAAEEWRSVQTAGAARKDESSALSRCLWNSGEEECSKGESCATGHGGGTASRYIRGLPHQDTSTPQCGRCWFSTEADAQLEQQQQQHANPIPAVVTEKACKKRCISSEFSYTCRDTAFSTHAAGVEAIEHGRPRPVQQPQQPWVQQPSNLPLPKSKGQAIAERAAVAAAVSAEEEQAETARRPETDAVAASSHKPRRVLEEKWALLLSLSPVASLPSSSLAWRRRARRSSLGPRSLSADAAQSALLLPSASLFQSAAAFAASPTFLVPTAAPSLAGYSSRCQCCNCTCVAAAQQVEHGQQPQHTLGGQTWHVSDTCLHTTFCSCGKCGVATRQISRSCNGALPSPEAGGCDTYRMLKERASLANPDAHISQLKPAASSVPTCISTGHVCDEDFSAALLLPPAATATAVAHAGTQFRGAVAADSSGSSSHSQSVLPCIDDAAKYDFSFLNAAEAARYDSSLTFSACTGAGVEAKRRLSRSLSPAASAAERCIPLVGTSYGCSTTAAAAAVFRGSSSGSSRQETAEECEKEGRLSRNRVVLRFTGSIAKKQKPPDATACANDRCRDADMCCHVRNDCIGCSTCSNGRGNSSSECRWGATYSDEVSNSAVCIMKAAAVNEGRNRSGASYLVACNSPRLRSSSLQQHHVSLHGGIAAAAEAASAGLSRKNTEHTEYTRGLQSKTFFKDSFEGGGLQLTRSLSNDSTAKEQLFCVRDSDFTISLTDWANAFDQHYAAAEGAATNLAAADTHVAASAMEAGATTTDASAATDAAAAPSAAAADVAAAGAAAALSSCVSAAAAVQAWRDIIGAASETPRFRRGCSRGHCNRADHSATAAAVCDRLYRLGYTMQPTMASAAAAGELVNFGDLMLCHRGGPQLTPVDTKHLNTRAFLYKSPDHGETFEALSLHGETAQQRWQSPWRRVAAGRPSACRFNYDALGIAATDADYGELGGSAYPSQTPAADAAAPEEENAALGMLRAAADADRLFFPKEKGSVGSFCGLEEAEEAYICRSVEAEHRLRFKRLLREYSTISRSSSLRSMSCNRSQKSCQSRIASIATGDKDAAFSKPFFVTYHGGQGLHCKDYTAKAAPIPAKEN